MSRKFEVTGKAVVYTEDGAKIIPCEVRRRFNINMDTNDFRFDIKTKKDLGENYLLIGGARTIPTDNIYAKPSFHPETVDYAYKFTQTKFFRLILDLMRLAQWHPIDNKNYMLHSEWFRDNRFMRGQQPDIDFSVSVADIDAQFFQKYEFSAQMIEFTEARYSYDELLYGGGKKR